MANFREKNNDIFRASICLRVECHFETVPPSPHPWLDFSRFYWLFDRLALGRSKFLLFLLCPDFRRSEFVWNCQNFQNRDLARQGSRPRVRTRFCSRFSVGGFRLANGVIASTSKGDTRRVAKEKQIETTSLRIKGLSQTIPQSDLNRYTAQRHTFFRLRWKASSLGELLRALFPKSYITVLTSFGARGVLTLPKIWKSKK